MKSLKLEMKAGKIVCFILVLTMTFGVLHAQRRNKGQTDPGAKPKMEDWAKPVMRGKAETITVEWIYPKATEISAFDEVVLEMKVQSSSPLTDSSFQVILDNINLAGSKSGEVNLASKKGEFLFRRRIKLNRNRDINIVRVEITSSDGSRVEAPVRFIRISKDLETKVNWSVPNLFALAGDPYILNQDQFRISLNIETFGRLDLQELQLIYNGTSFAPSSAATLTGEAGKFYFSDVLPVQNSSAFQTLQLKARGAASEVLKFSYVPLTAPDLHLISIGVQRDLMYSSADAKDIVQLFQPLKEKPSLFGKVEIQPLIGKEASTTAIKKAVARLEAKQRFGEIKANDLVLLFISSHGFIMDNNFWIQGNDYDPSAKDITSVNFKEDITNRLDRLRCKKVILIDACHSAAASGEKGVSIDPEAINQAIFQLNQVKDATIIVTSSRKEEYSYEDEAWKNGAFTESIVEGLKQGMADLQKKDGIVTIGELFSYLESRVPTMVKNQKGKPQHPEIIPKLSAEKDFAIYVRQNP